MKLSDKLTFKLWRKCFSIIYQRPEHDRPIGGHESGPKPDMVIGDGYLARWYMIKRNPFLNIYLHKFTGNDDDRALHDHPWWSLSIALVGSLDEHTIEKGGVHKTRTIDRCDIVFRKAKFAHRLELKSDAAWTLFITGPRIRQWGFHCPTGWVHWKKFTDPKDQGKIGAGCGE